MVVPVTPWKVLPDGAVTHILPAALATGAWQMWVLAGLYFVTALLAAAEFIRSAAYHKLRLGSFRSLFLSLCFMTMVLRWVLVFFAIRPWAVFWLVFFDFLFPLYLQFVTFSLLIVYLAKCLYVVQEREERVRQRLYPAYLILLGLLFAMLVAVCVLVSADWNVALHPQPGGRGVGEYDQSSSVYSSAVFALLVILVAIYGYKTHTEVSKFALNARKRRKVAQFNALTIMYFIVFLIRAAWNITYSLNVNPIQALLIHWNDQDQMGPYLVGYLVFYALIEVIPTLAVVLSFRLWLPSAAAPARRGYGPVAGTPQGGAGYAAPMGGPSLYQAGPSTEPGHVINRATSPGNEDAGYYRMNSRLSDY